MAFESQRFIHAANIRLDVPVSVQSTEPLTEQTRLVFEDATLTSFEYLIQACIAQKVDFLLLSGNTFIETDRSLRARLALLNGFRQLEAKQIRVFVLPGDGDPAEAWRSIPEMPANVSVCYSSSSEPVELVRKNHVIATVSASMWYGETDAFGIRVIPESPDGVQPFRIGVISQSKYEESLRMAAAASTATEDRLTVSLQNSAAASETQGLPGGTHGTMVPLSGKPRPNRENSSVDVSDLEDEESVILPGVPPEGAHSGDHRPDGQLIDQELQNWDPGFVSCADEMLREGRLNYLVLMSGLQRATLHRTSGILHCPGTTQPRVYRESAAGNCSLVEIAADGSVRLSEIDTSTIDWKDVEILVSSRTTLSSMLQTMKNRLLTQRVGSCDRIWSVNWTLRCSIPVLNELVQDDLAVTVAVELDDLKISGRTIRLMHTVRLLPTPWQIDDPRDPARRFQDIVSQSPALSRAGLLKLIETDNTLTVGWRQRLMALADGVEPEQILGRMRIDGAGWFIPDLSVLEEPAVEGLESDPHTSGPQKTDRPKSDRLKDTLATELVEDNEDDDEDDSGDSRGKRP